MPTERAIDYMIRRGQERERLQRGIRLAKGDMLLSGQVKIPPGYKLSSKIPVELPPEVLREIELAAKRS